MESKSFTFSKNNPSLNLKFDSQVIFKIDKMVSNNEFNFVQFPSFFLELKINSNKYPLKNLTYYTSLEFANYNVIELNDLYKEVMDIKIEIIDKSEKEYDFNITMFYELQIKPWVRDFIIVRDEVEIGKVRCYHNLKIDSLFHAESLSTQVIQEIKAESSDELYRNLNIEIRNKYGSEFKLKEVL